MDFRPWLALPAALRAAVGKILLRNLIERFSAPGFRRRLQALPDEVMLALQPGVNQFCLLRLVFGGVMVLRIPRQSVYWMRTFPDDFST
jgi:hypothetical protein